MKEYKDKTSQDLMKLIAEKRKGINDFRFGAAGSKVKNVKLSRTLHKDIARIMTELSLRRLAAPAKAKVATKKVVAKAKK